MKEGMRIVDAREFVSGLKKSVRNGVDEELQSLGNQINSDSPSDLTRFAVWLHRLSPSDRDTALDLMHFISEGALFRLLVYLDNVTQLGDEAGRFEMWFVAADGSKTLLNDTDGDLLHDLFNEMD